MSWVVIPPPQLYVYGAVPPEGVKLIDPVEVPLHCALITDTEPVGFGLTVTVEVAVAAPELPVAVTV